MDVAQILKRPFPLAPAFGSKINSAFAFGVFVFLFLLVFSPFGLDQLGDRLLITTLGYGAVTSLALLLIYFGLRPLFPQFFNETRWTVGREILNTLGAICLVTLGNVFFSAWMGFLHISVKSISVFLGFTAAVGVFPISIQVLLRQRSLDKRYSASSDEINNHIEHVRPISKQELLILFDEEGKEALQCPASHLIAMESADNYVKIYHEVDGTCTMVMVRNALMTFEKELASETSIFRTHRTYLVNLDKIDHVTGNARGYMLRLEGLKSEIPVARRRIEAFDRAMASR